MSLENLRTKIDETDSSIVTLIAERMKIVQDIGKEKKAQGKQIEDTARETKVFEHVRDIARKNNLSQDAIEGIYRQIISMSKNLQGTAVAFQGERGAYSEDAALRFFGPSIQVKPCKRLDDVFKMVEQEKVQCGIVPIENSLEGSISLTYDLLLDSSLKVRGEMELRVVHCLIASMETSLGKIKKVYSHPQALGQCQAFLKHLNCEIIPAYDTAGSVKMIKESGITDGAAIASARAAEIYGMQILAQQIEDNPNNFTRFFILGKEDSPPSGNDKTSIVFSVKHTPGALYQFLKELADNKINLTKIESRPTRQKAWDYNFYLDFEGHRDDKAPRKVLEYLNNSSIFVKVLGSYPRAN
ncbi:prephenate dehydratase [Chloroflexota bacterium]